MKILKFFLFTCISVSSLLTSSLSQSFASQTHQLNLMMLRHAEKSPSGGLSEKGLDRAKKLSIMLQDIKIKKIYSTNYLRTKQTVKPTAQLFHILPIIYYSNEQLIKMLKEDKETLGDKETILIVGHGNTIPSLIYHLGGPSMKDIPEDQYDNFYIMQAFNGNKNYLHLHY